MAKRSDGGLDSSLRGGAEQPTPPQGQAGSGGAPTEPTAEPVAEQPDPQGPTPRGDIERDRARAMLKSRLFQIEAEPVTIGRYTILSRLGQGGMGIVYSAYDEALDRKVAVKVVLPQGDSARIQERMRREAQAMARLSHPNIVGVHEVGQVDDQVFIAMEFVRGRSLDAWIREQAPPWTEVLEVYRQAGRGLAAAHEAGLVHRDFKPHNVMLGEDGSVKVLDFGLARDERRAGVEPRPERERITSERGDGSLTNTGAMIGTPAFMSPEQHLGQPVTARSDQFGFCVALHLGLHGTHPFEGSTLSSLVSSVLDGKLRELPAGDPVPLWVRRVVRRGLSRRPEDRFESMDELLDALAEDPGARQRRRFTQVGAVALVFAGGFAVAQLGGTGAAEATPCPDAQQALGQAWDEARRERVESAVLASDSPRAQETWARVAPRLSDYAEAWTRAHTATCEAHRRGERSDLLYERGRACLERGRAALDALAGALEQPDATTIDRAVTAAAGLPELTRCEDAEVLLAELTPPDEAIAAEVAALRERLSRARALEEMGRIDEAVTIADEVLARAEVLDYAPLRAEALLRRGTARVWAGQGPAADEDLGAASLLALEVDHEVVAAEAATRKVYARSELSGRPADAAIELPWAEALVARATAQVPDDALRALLLNNAGAVHVRNGDGERGLSLLRRSLELKRASLPKGHPQIALGLANVGRVERDLSRTDQAIATLREAAALLEAALGPRHPHRAMVATMLGTTAIDLGRYAEAEAELALADAIHREILGTDAMPRFFVLRARGELALRRRQWDRAQAVLEEALALAEPRVGADHPMLAEVHYGLARVDLARGRVDEAVARTRAAVERLEATLGENHPNVAQGWIHLGRRQLEAGRAEDARASFERAREAKRAADHVDPLGVAWSECWLGRAWLALGELVRADELLEGCLRALPEGEPRRVEAMGARAEVLRALGDAEGSVQWYARAEAILAAERPADDPELAWARVQLAAARYEAAADASARAGARQRAVEALEVLSTSTGWTDESSTARQWLEREDARADDEPASAR